MDSVGYNVLDAAPGLFLLAQLCFDSLQILFSRSHSFILKDLQYETLKVHFYRLKKQVCFLRNIQYRQKTAKNIKV